MTGFILFAVATGLLLGLRQKWLVPCFAMLLPVLLVLTVLGLGYPRPRALGFPETITVVAVQLDPERAIYLWSDEPVAYTLPWDPALAAEMTQAGAQAEATGEAGFAVELDWSYGEGTRVQDESPQRGPEK